MNEGIIAGRYGKAFFEFTRNQGDSDDVFAQVRTLLSAFAAIPQLRDVFSNPRRTSFGQKLDLLRGAVSPQELSPSLERFLALMDKNGRLPYFRMALFSYLELYRKSHNLVMVQVTYASRQDELLPMITEFAKRDAGLTPVFREKEDPGLIGGYIVETWDWRFDASVKGALERAREQLVQKTKRLV